MGSHHPARVLTVDHTNNRLEINHMHEPISDLRPFSGIRDTRRTQTPERLYCEEACDERTAWSEVCNFSGLLDESQATSPAKTHEHLYREEACVRLIYQNRLRDLRRALAGPMPDIAALVADIDETIYTASQLYGDTLSLSETAEYQPAPQGQKPEDQGEEIDYAQRW